MSNIDLKALLDDFDQAAQDWGWQSDMGTTHVGESLAAYEQAKAALIAGIESAERRAEEAEKERDALLERAWNAGFIEASKWPAPHASDVDSASADRKRRADISAVVVEPGAETAPKSAKTRVAAGFDGGAGMAQEGGK